MSEEEGAKFAERMGTLFVEASAKTSVGVHEAFQEVVTRVRPFLLLSLRIPALNGSSFERLDYRHADPVAIPTGQESDGRRPSQPDTVDAWRYGQANLRSGSS